MSKQNSNTYGKLCGALRALGFESRRYGTNVVFTHASGRPLILLPSYRSGQVVKPIHLMMVRKQLADAGMIEPGAALSRPRSNPGEKAKILGKSALKIES